MQLFPSVRRRRSLTNQFDPPATQADVIRWHLVLMLVSMDSVTPFLGDMGLQMNEIDILKPYCRMFVQKYRQIENDAVLSTEQRLAKYQELFRVTFAEISRLVSNDIANTLYHWGSVTFQYGSDIDAQAFIWRRLFRRLAEISSLAYQCAELVLSVSKVEMVKKAIKTHLNNFVDLEKRIRSTEREPKSPWDRELFESYTVGASPMDWVLNSIEFVNTMAVWREIHALLNDREILQLLDWGKRQAEIMEMSSENLELPAV